MSRSTSSSRLGDQAGLSEMSGDPPDLNLINPFDIGDRLHEGAKQCHALLSFYMSHALMKRQAVL
ncbi:hypothetical protein FV232_07000 [Methylobacterium sp. WL30]|uniref:hypothetical protein n=1 Tax=Methylobacterium sp. WL30 TaxID=2603895 RepID=UPI0011CB2458|nr:hypothetical protein [Methylobacterium sp. WL30]TXN40431.1 hypothetical protein FV225_06105 [Methylobacterium sp. WL93]TXN49140.1 hypothetical protein FV227_17830 [Methylobacterium sp. WL119]TXN68979.1 hypothetical protein FV232_07000 [Methylobacterium sp. WL30]